MSIVASPALNDHIYEDAYLQTLVLIYTGKRRCKISRLNLLLGPLNTDYDRKFTEKRLIGAFANVTYVV